MTTQVPTSPPDIPYCATHRNQQESGHPYGVEPLGNVFLRGSSNCRPHGLGTLAVFDDERMLDLMGYMSVASLGRLAVVSRAFYVLAHVEDLWKNIVVQEMVRRPGQSVQTRGGWKETLRHVTRTLAGSINEAGSAAHSPLKVRGYFSDLLFQPYHCATAAIRPEWLDRNDVDRRTALSPEEFRRVYEEPNKPVVLTDAAASWPAIEKWTKRELSRKHAKLRVHAGGLEFALKDYLCYADESTDELPLYVFDKRFCEKCPELGRDYSVPDVFPDDLFSVLGNERRPDFRWLIAGPARSGSSFHVDPNCTSAWNATVCGRKKWILFPPGETPPGVHPSQDGLDLAAPVSLMEWYLNFYEECHAPGRKIRPLECVVSAGEVVFVPMGWWHCVLNLEWSVAVTQNFVSTVNLPHVIRFLLKEKHLISGLPPGERGDLGERFVAALRARRPDLCTGDIARYSTTSAAAKPFDDGRDLSDSARRTRKTRVRSGSDSSKRVKMWEKLKSNAGPSAAPSAAEGKGNKDDAPAPSGRGFSFAFSFS